MTNRSYRHVVVVGPGRMGCTIALAYAFAGLTVSLVDAQQTDATEKPSHRPGVPANPVDSVSQAHALLGQVTHKFEYL